MSERKWLLYTAGSSLLAVTVSVYCLTQGITTVFTHLYYIPILLASYRYRQKGVFFSLALAAVYLALVFLILPGRPYETAAALIRAGAFAAISVIISALSSEIKASVEALTREIDGHRKTETALRESENRYMELSITDSLTGLHNQRHFYQMLQAEIGRSERYGRPLSLILLDIDDFKHFNDTFGHMEGDRVLERIGATITRCVRRTDSAFRYGGEEFTVIMPETAGDHAATVAERIRAEFREERYRPVPGTEVFKTVSTGVAEYRPGEDMKDFISRADRSMYEAKRLGKDRVHLSGETR